MCNLKTSQHAACLAFVLHHFEAGIVSGTTNSLTLIRQLAQLRPGTSYIKLYRYITQNLTIISLKQEPVVFKQYLQLLNHT